MHLSDHFLLPQRLASELNQLTDHHIFDILSNKSCFIRLNWNNENNKNPTVNSYGQGKKNCIWWKWCFITFPCFCQDPVKFHLKIQQDQTKTRLQKITGKSIHFSTSSSLFAHSSLPPSIIFLLVSSASSPHFSVLFFHIIRSSYLILPPSPWPDKCCLDKVLVKVKSWADWSDHHNAGCRPKLSTNMKSSAVYCFGSFKTKW